jgi:hypothetical protein
MAIMAIMAIEVSGLLLRVSVGSVGSVALALGLLAILSLGSLSLPMAMAMAMARARGPIEILKF